MRLRIIPTAMFVATMELIVCATRFSLFLSVARWLPPSPSTRPARVHLPPAIARARREAAGHQGAAGASSLTGVWGTPSPNPSTTADTSTTTDASPELDDDDHNDAGGGLPVRRGGGIRVGSLVAVTVAVGAADGDGVGAAAAAASASGELLPKRVVVFGRVLAVADAVAAGVAGIATVSLNGDGAAQGQRGGEGQTTPSPSLISVPVTELSAVDEDDHDDEEDFQEAGASTAQPSAETEGVAAPTLAAAVAELDDSTACAPSDSKQSQTSLPSAASPSATSPAVASTAAAAPTASGVGLKSRILPSAATGLASTEYVVDGEDGDDDDDWITPDNVASHVGQTGFTKAFHTVRRVARPHLVAGLLYLQSVPQADDDSFMLSSLTQTPKRSSPSPRPPSAPPPLPLPRPPETSCGGVCGRER